MRISDWSSDVCSSDLPDLLRHRRHHEQQGAAMTEKRNADFRLVDSVVGDDAKPGDAKYWRDGEGVEGLNFQCPCGCGSLLGVSFGPGRWSITGPRDRPTVNPSILHMDGCRWHGYLTAGRFVEC